jgi:hypothetical protein
MKTNDSTLEKAGRTKPPAELLVFLVKDQNAPLASLRTQ